MSKSASASKAAALKSVAVSDMSFHDMRKLMLVLQDEMREKERGARANLRKRLEAMALDGGFTLDELFPSLKRRRGTTPTEAAKFRNPANPKQVWSGRGRRPEWLVKAVSQGRDPNEFRAH